MNIEHRIRVGNEPYIVRLTEEDGALGLCVEDAECGTCQTVWLAPARARAIAEDVLRWANGAEAQ